jgi:RNA-directed DNA polymerase
MQPSRYRHLVARGLARALLAGPPERDGLLARATQALGGTCATLPALVDELLPIPDPVWQQLTAQTLADRLVQTDGFQDVLHEQEAPFIRRWILRPSAMSMPPLGLEGLPLPALGDSAALAHWLGITVDELDWFTFSSARRRQVPLHAQHYGFSWQHKRTGGVRLIEAPRRRLKALQQQVLHGLLDHVPVHEGCHGFVAGRSVLSHAAQHAGQAVVLKFDLRDFFSSVGASRVAAIFHTLGYPQGVAAQLSALCTVSTPDAVLQRLRDEGSLDWWRAKQLASPHLPQGAPTSPALANLSAFNLDLRLKGLAHVLGARYSRYADDLVLSGPGSLGRVAPRVMAWVARIAEEEGYALNHRKTRHATQAAQQRVCGVVVNQRPNLSRREFDRLRAALHRCTVEGPASQNREGHADFRAHLLGRLQWATQVNPAKAERLKRLWDRIDWAAA